MRQQIQVYAFVHSMEDGIVVMTPADNNLNRCKFSASDVDLVFDTEIPRRALVTIPEYLAIGKGLRKPDPLEEFITQELDKADWNEVANEPTPPITPSEEQQQVDDQRFLLRHAVRRQGDALRNELRDIDIEV